VDVATWFEKLTDLAGMSHFIGLWSGMHENLTGDLLDKALLEHYTLSFSSGASFSATDD
jgi:hypothetical protein